MMEIKFTGSTAAEIRDQLADWLNNLGGASEPVQATAKPAATKKVEPTKPQHTNENAVDEKPATKEKAGQGTLEGVPADLDEVKLRKFCAQAVKKDVPVVDIIEGISGGEVNLSNIDKSLYPRIYAQVKETLEKANG